MCEDFIANAETVLIDQAVGSKDCAGRNLGDGDAPRNGLTGAPRYCPHSLTHFQELCLRCYIGRLLRWLPKCRCSWVDTRLPVIWPNTNQRTSVKGFCRCPLGPKWIGPKKGRFPSVGLTLSGNLKSDSSTLGKTELNWKGHSPRLPLKIEKATLKAFEECRWPPAERQQGHRTSVPQQQGTKFYQQPEWTLEEILP